MENNLIGGTDPGAGNLISGNYMGIRIAGISNMVYGNWIGVDSSGNARLANYIGVYISGGNNVVGDVNAGARNVISGNMDNVYIEHSGLLNHVLANYIGVGADGTTPIGGYDGVTVAGDENIIGGGEWVPAT